MSNLDLEQDLMNNIALEIAAAEDRKIFAMLDRSAICLSSRQRGLKGELIDAKYDKIPACPTKLGLPTDKTLSTK